MRRTKIIATLGPATSDAKMLDKIIDAGVDVVRVNFSHGTSEEHIERAEQMRNRARAHGRQVGVLCDLQGPKIRIERFKDKKIPQINISASIDSQNKIHITLCNLNHFDKTKIKCELKGSIKNNIKANILTNKKMNAHNTFENPEEVKPVLFREVSIEENNLSLEIPPKSIIALEVC